MNTESPDSRPAPLDGLDFELTDFSDARRALDELPAGVGVARTLEPGYWEARRRRSETTDRALTGAAIDWMLSLPADLRPKALCERFPRVANSLSTVWGQEDARRQALERLANDERGRRAGFPYAVRQEIERLHAAYGPPGTP